MIKEEIKYIKEAPADLKKFGLTVGAVLLIAGAILFYIEKGSYIYFSAAGIFLILAGLFYPAMLKPINKAWMVLALILGWFMTRVILSILFYFVLTPTGFIAKISGKKFLDLKFDKKNKSYWEKRELKEKKQIDYERQF